ncbi:MAG: hypothetical protein L3J04_04680 [Robiginitomaculum sp.]|nr:hypothetical protein [Robiginitomaculum sp.]
MTYRIVILTKQAEAPFLVEFIRNENPELEVSAALTEAELRQQIGEQGACTRLISFNNHIIIPKDILDALGPVPYNIHPGPPEYPGSYPVVFALRDYARKYGVTAHEIAIKVDAGPIVYVEQTPIAPHICIKQLTDLAYTMAVTAFSFIAKHCAHSQEPLPHFDHQWSGIKSTRKSYQELCQVPANASDEEIKQLRKVCGDDLVLDAPAKVA